MTPQLQRLPSQGQQGAPQMQRSLSGRQAPGAVQNLEGGMQAGQAPPQVRQLQQVRGLKVV
jgi:hypothetical protein